MPQRLNVFLHFPLKLIRSVITITILEISGFPQPQRLIKNNSTYSQVREGIYPQFTTTSVNMWITIVYVGIVYIYKVTLLGKSKSERLINRGERSIIIEICQNELSNHTHVTVLEYTVFVPGFHPKPDAPYLSAAALKAAHV